MEGSKLKRIKNYAFECCESLRYVELPDHEIVIEKYVFNSYVDLKSQNIICEEIEDDDDHYEEEDGEDLEFDTSIIVIPTSVEKFLYISNKQKTTKIAYEEGSKLKEIKYMYLNEGMIDVFLPPSVEKIKYCSFKTKLKSLNIMNNNFKTSDEGIVTSFYPRAILFVQPNIESIDIDPKLEIIFSYLSVNRVSSRSRCLLQ